MKRAVNNKRKSLSQTPVQKTTLLNFFPRTPGTSNATPKTRTLLDYFPKTPSTNQTPCQVPKSSSLLSTPVVRKGEPLKLDSTPTDCPGCGRSIPLYRLNEHLDDECPTSLKRPPRTIREPTTPVRVDIVERKAVSASRLDDLRRDEMSSSPKRALTGIKKARGQPSSPNLRKRLFEDDKPKYEVPYYLESFLFFLKSTFEEALNHHLLIEEDHQIYKTFLGLSSPAKQLYVRLFTRKFQWRRREKIVYPDISSDLQPFLRELVKAGFLQDADSLDDFQEALRLLNQPELKSLFKETKLPFNGKANALEVLLKHCKNQPCAMLGSSTSMMDRMLLKLKKNYITEAYKLKEDIRRILLRLILLSTLHQRPEEEEEKGAAQQSFNMLQVSIGRKSYPDYVIKRSRPIFGTRKDYLDYGEAVILELKVREPFEKKDWISVVDLTDGLSIKVLRRDRQLPVFLRRFTGGAVKLHLLDKRLEALQSLKRYEEAVELLEQLIGQDCYLLNHRGYWYERLALNIDQHLKDPQKALDVIRSGLKDDHVTPAHRLALSQRAQRICQSKLKVENVLKELPLLIPSEPKCVVIIGRSMPTNGLSGRKSTFIHGDSQVSSEGGQVTLCSVEELVLSHYSVEGGYLHGIHGEGSTLWTIVALIFWDVIYDSNIPDVFLSPFQALPLDLDSPDFFNSREKSILNRLENLKSWNLSELLDWMKRNWEENHGKTSLVAWERFRDLDHLVGLVECIPTQVLAAVSERLLKNYRHYRSGFPDLIVWNLSEKKWKVVEVKGPNDRLSTKQTLWLDFLVSIGVDAEVCHVQAVGAKRMGATPTQLPTRSSKKSRPTALIEEADDFEMELIKPKKRK